MIIRVSKNTEHSTNAVIIKFFALLQWKLTVSIGSLDNQAQYIRFNTPITPRIKEPIKRNTKIVLISILLLVLD